MGRKTLTTIPILLNLIGWYIIFTYTTNNLMLIISIVLFLGSVPISMYIKKREIEDEFLIINDCIEKI